MLAVVFAAFPREGPVVLGAEHANHEWLPAEQALERLVWPRSRSALRDALSLLANGDAGPVEDVLRVDLATLRDPPNIGDDALLLGVARVGSQLVAVVDAEALVAACLTDRALEHA